MKTLHFDYCMEISYSENVNRCYYTIKCIPQDTERQKITDFQIEMEPPSKPEWSYDSLGNRYIWGCNDSPHAYFRFRVLGDAECGDCVYESVTTENEEMIYRHSSKMTVAGDKIKNYFNKLESSINGFSELSDLEKAKALMNSLYQDFEYTKGSTSVSTSAEDAFCIGKGVCQDYAHILTSLLLLSGCSARYVTGLIIGEGESHAWVEVADNGKWYGLDPTHNISINDTYIKIGVGRDATECLINKGIMHGGGDQTQTISVSVSEISTGQKFLRKGAIL